MSLSRAEIATANNELYFKINLSYLSLIPVGVFCLFSFYSYFIVKLRKRMNNRSNQEKSSEITAQILPITQPLISKYNEYNIPIPPCYYIKQRLSFFVCLTIIIRIIFKSFIGMIDFCYFNLIELSIWIISIFLLKYDFANRRRQKYYNNSLFWFLSSISDFISLLFCPVNYKLLPYLFFP